MKYFILFLFTLLSFRSGAQEFSISGKISSLENGITLIDATVCINPINYCANTDADGNYKIKKIKPGTYTLIVVAPGYDRIVRQITVADKSLIVDAALIVRLTMLDSVSIRSTRKAFGTTYLQDVDGTGIYAGKKSEVIVLKDITANTATNNTRQIYARIAGLNIWENDGGAGIQLSIGGRGLDPNRVSNFNTRQNGYDISADALGYPESYYTPPAEALERIEIVRGASSLQYGTQFGGIINFKMNKGVDTQKLQLISRETGGSWNFFNTSNSIGGTIKKLNYYLFYQHKSGNGWRPNSQFNVNTVYGAATLIASSSLSITAEYTHMDYLEQQPGGINDQMFESDPNQSTKSRNWFKVNWNLGAAIVDYRITDNLNFNTRFFGLLANRSALGIINTVTDPGGARQYRTDDYTNWGNETRLLYNYNFKHNNPFTILVGSRYYSGYTDRRIGNGNDGSGGAKSDFAFSKTTLVDSLNYSRYKFPNHNTAFFAENIFRVSSKFSIIPGMRYEHIVTEANGFYNNFVQDQAGNVINNQVENVNKTSNRSFLIAGLGFSYDQSSALHLYANISQNYKSINFNDIGVVNPNIVVDSNLKDERGYSADLGVRGQYRSIVNYDISLFTINYANRIGNELLVNKYYQTYLFTTNISQSRNFGAESYIEADIWRLIKGQATKTKLIVFSNLAWITAQYVHSQETAYENKRVEFVPDIILKTGVTLRRNKFSATYQFAYTGKQFTDATNSVTPTNNGINGLVPSYFVMDFSADYKINRIFSVSASVNNLSNNMYYTRRADSYPGPGIIPADPRAYYVTLQVKI